MMWNYSEKSIPYCRFSKRDPIRIKSDRQKGKYTGEEEEEEEEEEEKEKEKEKEKEEEEEEEEEGEEEEKEGESEDYQGPLPFISDWV